MRLFNRRALIRLAVLLAATGAATGAGVVTFTRNNPFLSSTAIAALTTANPMFGAGAPLFLSKIFTDLVPADEQTYDTETMRAVVGLEGDFMLAQREMYWTVSASQARVKGESRRWDNLIPLELAMSSNGGPAGGCAAGCSSGACGGCGN